MSENETPQEENPQGQQEAAQGQQANFALQRVYVKDVSFESPNSPVVFQKPWQNSKRATRRFLVSPRTASPAMKNLQPNMD